MKRFLIAGLLAAPPFYYGVDLVARFDESPIAKTSSPGLH